jgi:hypothetical protein
MNTFLIPQELLCKERLKEVAYQQNFIIPLIAENDNTLTHWDSRPRANRSIVFE